MRSRMFFFGAFLSFSSVAVSGMYGDGRASRFAQSTPLKNGWHLMSQAPWLPSRWSGSACRRPLMRSSSSKEMPSSTPGSTA